MKQADSSPNQLPIPLSASLTSTHTHCHDLNSHQGTVQISQLQFIQDDTGFEERTSFTYTYTPNSSVMLLKDGMKTACRLARNKDCNWAHLGCCSIWNEAKQILLNSIPENSTRCAQLPAGFSSFFHFLWLDISPYWDGWCRSLSENPKGASDLEHCHRWWRGWWPSLRRSLLHPVQETISHD